MELNCSTLMKTNYTLRLGTATTLPSAPVAFIMKKVAQRVVGFLPFTEIRVETCPSALASALALGFRWRPLLSKTCLGAAHADEIRPRFRRRRRSAGLGGHLLFRRHPFAVFYAGDVFNIHVPLGIPMSESFSEQERNADLFRLLKAPEVSRRPQA
jgi:hypothetical protein